MRALALLLRLNALELFGFNRLRNDPTRRKRARWVLPLIALGALAALGVVGVYCFGIAYGFQYMGALDVYPALMAAVAAIAVLTTTIFKAPDALFRSRDFDQMLSLPIPARAVAAARMIKLYSIELLFTLMVLLPAGVAYVYFARPGAWFYPAYLLTMLAVPLVPLALSSLLGVLTAFLGASVKRARYAGLVLSFAVTLGVLAGSMAISAASSRGMEQLANLARSLSEMLGRVYPLSGIYSAAVVGRDLGALLLFVLGSLLVFALEALLFGRVFVRLNTFINAQRARGGYVVRAQRQRGVLKALLAREWRRYFASNIYVMNTAIGLLLSLIGAVALAVAVPRDEVALALGTIGLEGPVFAMLPFALAWFVSMSPTTGCSISLEGRNLWIVRGLPIPARRWLLAKLLLNLQMLAPIVLIDAAVLAVALGIRGLALLVLALLPLFMGAFVSLFGLALNCRVYRFDWTNETKVVKQSWGTGLPVLLSMLLAFGGGALTVRFAALDHMLVPLVFTGAMAIGCAAIWLWISKNAEAWVRRM